MKSTINKYDLIEDVLSDLHTIKTLTGVIKDVIFEIDDNNEYTIEHANRLDAMAYTIDMLTNKADASLCELFKNM